MKPQTPLDLSGGSDVYGALLGRNGSGVAVLDVSDGSETDADLHVLEGTNDAGDVGWLRVAP